MREKRKGCQNSRDRTVSLLNSKVPTVYIDIKRSSLWLCNTKDSSTAVSIIDFLLDIIQDETRGCPV